MLDRDPAVAWRKIGFFGFLGLGAISACGPPALAMGSRKTMPCWARRLNPN